MGAAQSTRKITLVNDDKAGVIKLSESLAHRLRGQLEEQQYRQNQRVQEPPAAAVEPVPLPTPILTPPPVDLPPPPPPTLETAKIPSLIPEAPPAEAQTQGESPKDEIVAPVLSKDAHIDNLDPLDLPPETFPKPTEPILEAISETPKHLLVDPSLSENTETLTFIETRPDPSPPVDKTPVPSEAIVQFLPDEPQVLPSVEEVPPPKSEDVEAVASAIEVDEVETAELSGDIASGIGEVGSGVSTNDVLIRETVTEVPTVEIPESETLLAAAFTSSDEPITASASPDIPSEPVISTAPETIEVPEPISIAPEPVVTPEPLVQEPVVAAEPIIETEPIVVPEPAVVAEPVVPEPVPVVIEPVVPVPEPEPVVVEPVTVEEPVIIEPTVPEPVITESATVTEPIVAEPVVEVEPLTITEPVVAEPIVVADPVTETVPEPSPVIASEPEPTLAAAFPESLAVTPGASPTLDVAAVAADVAAAAVSTPASVVAPTATVVAEALPETAPVESEPPAAVAAPDVGSAIQAGAGPSLAAPGGTIPPWSIYAEEAHLMVMRLKAEKDQEIKKLSDEWRAKLDQREEEFVKTSALTEENFTASLKEVESMFVKATCDPVCQNQQEEVMKCYQDHPHQSLRCAREVSQFAQCVDLSRLQAVMKQN